MRHSRRHEPAKNKVCKQQGWFLVGLVSVSLPASGTTDLDPERASSCRVESVSVPGANVSVTAEASQDRRYRVDIRGHMTQGRKQTTFQHPGKRQKPSTKNFGSWL